MPGVNQARSARAGKQARGKNALRANRRTEIEITSARGTWHPATSIRRSIPVQRPLSLRLNRPNKKAVNFIPNEVERTRWGLSGNIDLTNTIVYEYICKIRFAYGRKLHSTSMHLAATDPRTQVKCNPSSAPARRAQGRIILDRVPT
jgi:hypothetical protein